MKIGSVEGLDWKIPLSILCRDMKVTVTFSLGTASELTVAGINFTGFVWIM